MALSQENRIQMAISAYRSNQIRSQIKAAEIFGVPRLIFQERLRGIKSRSETRANGYKLTEFEEELLLKRLLDADMRGFLIRPEFLRGMAEVLLCNRLQNPTAALGSNWPYRFIKRYPELRTRYTRRITYQRAKQEDPKVIKPWFETVRATI
jgi:predicted HTH domain antitoxin